MVRETMDDESIWVIIFDVESQDCVVFQPYTPGSSADYRGHELVWRKPPDSDKDED